MTLATMTDRTLPLAERVTAAYLVGIQVADGDENGQDARAALDSLRVDIAAADRLMRAFRRLDECDTDDHDALEGAWSEYRAARIAYRARMAQEVDRGA